MPNKPIFIGIDLGTSNSATAVWREDLKTTVTIKDLGFDVTPSVVAFNDEGERLVGTIAKDQQKVNPRNTIHGVKQIIGRRFTDREVALTARHWPFPVVSHKDGTCRIQVATKAGRATLVRPEEISAAVLSRLVANAAARMHAPVEGAVITVPANFNHQQRIATKNAATIAGIKVLKLMNEPSAAAYAYGASDLDEEEVDRHMLIFDLGGGTLDLAVLFVPAVNDTGASESGMKIKAVDADLSLGGDTFTGRLAQYCLQQLPAVSGFDQSMFLKPLVKHMIYKECETVKQHLSFCRTASVNVQLGGDASAQLEITRDTFEDLCKEDFQRIYEPLNRVLTAAKLQRSNISRVLLVGGSTRIPAVHAILADFFGSKVVLNEQVDVNVAVAHGAAIEAARIQSIWKPPLRRGSSEPDMRPPPIEPHATNFGRRPRINTVSVPIPAQDHKSKPSTQLPPKDVAFEVLPHTLSVVYNQGECCPMLRANTQYPASSHESFDKQWPDQDSITITIMEGPSLRARENRMLERFEIAGLRHLRQGVLISFHVNKSGIMEVSAQAIEDASKAKKITVHALEPGINHTTMNRLREDEARQAHVDIMHQPIAPPHAPHPAPLPPPVPAPAPSPEMLNALGELDALFRHQQEVSLQGPDTQRHFQLIRDDFLRMNANGEILSLADIKDVMHRLTHIPVPAGPGGDSICAVRVG